LKAPRGVPIQALGVPIRPECARFSYEGAQAHTVLCADEIAYHYRLLSRFHFAHAFWGSLRSPNEHFSLAKNRKVSSQKWRILILALECSLYTQIAPRDNSVESFISSDFSLHANSSQGQFGRVFHLNSLRAIPPGTIRSGFISSPTYTSPRDNLGIKIGEQWTFP